MYADFPSSSILNHLRGWPTGMRGPAGLPCGCFFAGKLTAFGLDGDAAVGCWPASSALAGCMTDSLSVVSWLPGRPQYRLVFHDDRSYMTCILLKKVNTCQTSSASESQWPLGSFRSSNAFFAVKPMLSWKADLLATSLLRLYIFKDDEAQTVPCQPCPPDMVVFQHAKLSANLVNVVVLIIA